MGWYELDLAEGLRSQHGHRSGMFHMPLAVKKANKQTLIWHASLTGGPKYRSGQRKLARIAHR